ncbi:VTT domain-containing protein [Candidatus Jorgensenbacteria bacterium]|nr:VTT domain-containing protein [Candidatus Jorgensenbacteria bacterium]
MSGILENIGQLVLTQPSWSYIIIGVGALIQGELTVLISVYLIVSGHLEWGGFIVATLGGVFLGEIIIYIAGRILRHTRFGWKIYRRLKPNRRIQFYTYYLKRNLYKLFIVAKFLIGANVLVMLLTGWSRTKFSTFIKAYLPGLLIWFSSITFVAYSLASSLEFLKTQKIFRQVELGLVLFIAALFVGETFLRKFLNRKMFGGIKPEDLKDVLEDEIKTP